jgi:hypothetical protein
MSTGREWVIKELVLTPSIRTEAGKKRGTIGKLVSEVYQTWEELKFTFGAADYTRWDVGMTGIVDKLAIRCHVIEI